MADGSTAPLTAGPATPPVATAGKAKGAPDPLAAAQGRADTALAALGPELQGIESRASAGQSKIDQRIDEATKSYNETMKGLQPTPPPTPKQTDPKQAWASAAMALAGLAPLLTRTPLTTAMNAASKVLDAYRAGDQAAANAAFQTWKIANDNAAKIATMTQDAYKNILGEADRRSREISEDATRQERAVVAEATAYAHSVNDAVMIETLKQRGIQGAQELQLRRDQLETQRAEHATELELEHQGMQQIAAYDADPANRSKSPVQQAHEKADILREFSPHMYNQSFGNPIVQQRLANQLQAQIEKTGEALAYKNIETYGSVIENAATKMSQGQTLNMQEQAAVLEASQRLTTNQAIRGFLVKLNQDHAGLGDRVSLALQRMSLTPGQGGGPLDPAMAKNIIDMVHEAERNNLDKFVPTIKRAMDQAAYLHIPAEMVVPKDVPYEALGGYQGNPEAYEGQGGDKDAGAAAPPAPAVGTVEDGYKFKGGDPADPTSWQKVG